MFAKFWSHTICTPRETAHPAADVGCPQPSHRICFLDILDTKVASIWIESYSVPDAHACGASLTSDRDAQARFSPGGDGTCKLWSCIFSSYAPSRRTRWYLCRLNVRSPENARMGLWTSFRCQVASKQLPKTSTEKAARSSVSIELLTLVADETTCVTHTTSMRI